MQHKNEMNSIEARKNTMLCNMDENERKRLFICNVPVAVKKVRTLGLVNRFDNRRYSRDFDDDDDLTSRYWSYLGWYRRFALTFFINKLLELFCFFLSAFISRLVFVVRFLFLFWILTRKNRVHSIGQQWRK